jgi:hypothetical protein
VDESATGSVNSFLLVAQEPKGDVTPRAPLAV